MWTPFADLSADVAIHGAWQELGRAHVSRETPGVDGAGHRARLGLVLYQGEVELRRVPIDLHPNELQIVTPGA